jgi:hypothetical protein
MYMFWKLTVLPPKGSAVITRHVFILSLVETDKGHFEYDWAKTWVTVPPAVSLN